jgi:hypothetical protein
MNQAEKELILSQVELKIGMVKTFYKDKEGADELISLYEDYLREGTSTMEIKLFLEDLYLFLESVR